MDTPPFGKLPERDEYIRQELNRILDTYGNHPSFGFMAMGNESGGSLETLVRSGRARDPRHLFRCENGDDLEHGDYIEAGMRGIVGPPTDWDRWSVRDLGWIASNEGNKMRPSRTTLPTFVHELGQWEMYPDLDEVKKYTGTLRAHYFEDYHRSLVTHRMLDQAKDFAEASGKFSLLLYKEEIEASLRTFPLGGFQILEARDYPGQGVAIVGWLDAFWESKGLITPQEFREFCAPTVCLLRMPTRTITTADTFVARAEISHFGPTNLETTPEWSIRCENGEVIAQGRWPACTLQTGQVTPVGKISATLQSVTAPARLVVNVRAAGKENRWNIWVYPNKQPLVPTDVVIAHHFDQTTRDALVSGKRVLMFSSPTEGVIYPRHASLVPNSVRALPVAQPGRSAIPGSFMPTFYSLQLFNQIGTLGILCDPRHPALADFPTEKHADWQWADLLGNFSAGNSFQVAGAPESTAESSGLLCR
jgi:hypothetical protein